MLVWMWLLQVVLSEENSTETNSTETNSTEINPTESTFSNENGDEEGIEDASKMVENLTESKEIQAQEPRPIDQNNLSNWWKAAGQLRLGDTAYRITQPVQFKDGVCDVSFQEGMLIPVYTGTAPVSERIVGVVFVGDGALSLRFPERADAWTFANHMARFGGKTVDEMAPIAAGQEKYSVGLTQGLILSADPRVAKLIYNLEPVGGGVYFSEKADGEADATYVVTERRGKLRAQMVATNILADRADALQRLGLDPRAMLRQDRLLQEELGFPGHYVRVIGDYQTTDRFHVAAQGTSVSSMDYDKWMTCYRDGRDEAGVGYRAMAFASGVDLDKRQHFQRFSGLKFTSANPDELPRPPFRMEAVSAVNTVEFATTRNKLYQNITVDSTLTFKASGADLQYLPMRLPTKGSERGSWVLEELTLSDGRELAWVGLNADLSDTGSLRRSRIPLQEVDVTNNQVALEDADSLSSGTPTLSTSQTSLTQTTGQEASGTSSINPMNPQDISTAKIDPPAGPANFRLDPSEQIVAQSERTTTRSSEYTYDIIALLPEPIQAGEEVTVRLKWTARWQFANFSSIETPNGVAVRSLGTTTGVYPILPEVLPLAGGTRWDFTITAGTKSPLLRPQYVVASGDTQKTWQDEGLWNWTESSGKDALSPAVGVGRWEIYTEAPAKGLPAVRVSLFPNTFSKAKMFAPEIRRVLTFYNGFLPGYDQQEVDVYQDRSLLINEVRRPKRAETQYGTVQIQTISPASIGLTDELREEDSKRAQTQIARQLAGQYWGQRIAPNNERDTWMMLALSDAYAAYYVRAAFGQEEHEKRMLGVRNLLENPEEQDAGWTRADAHRRSYSPAGSTHLSDVPQKFRSDYAFYVLTEMLRLQLGNQAYFSALEKLATQPRVSTESLQAIFEEVSGQDLQDFFDFWIYGGYIPKIVTEIRYDEDGVNGCVTSDVPFGNFFVPIRIHLPEKKLDSIIQVSNGTGSFWIPNAPKETSFEVDPLALILAFERSIKVVKGPLSCEKSESE